MKIDTVFLDDKIDNSKVNFTGKIINDLTGNSPVNSNSSLEVNTKPASKEEYVSKNKGYLRDGYKSIKNKNEYGKLSKSAATKVNPNEVKQYLLSKGYSKAATAGILANIQAESNFDSSAVGDNGNAYGLFQHNGVRKNSLLDYAASRGLNRNDWRVQIDYMETDISPEFKRKLNAMKTSQEVADTFVRGYEKPANIEAEALKRANYSTQFFKYGGVIAKKDMGGYISQGGYMNEYQQPDIGGGILKGALTGAGSMASTGSIWGMLAGAVIGGVSGGITGGKKKRQYEDAMRKQNEQMNRYMQNQSNSILAMYSPQGQAGQYGYYKFGGKLPKYALGTQIDNPEYEAEKGEVVQGENTMLEQSTQISSDIHLVEGKKHEDGGTLGAGGERVFTDRLPIPTELIDLLKRSGLKVKEKNPTYANIALKIGELKGKFEEKVQTNDYITKNTGNVMLGKMNSLLDLTFSVQEADKADKGLVNDPNENGNIIPEEGYFKFGGKIPKLAWGADVNWDVFNQRQTGLGDLNNFNSKFGLAVSTAGLINDLVSTNRMNTNVPAFMQNAPAYLYNDRSGLQRNENRAAYRNFVNNPLTQGSLTNQFAFANLIKQDNTIAQNENLRRDQYNLNYQHQARQNDANNLQRITDAQRISMQLQNQQMQARQGAVNNYLNNLQNVVRETDQRNRDQQRLDITRETLKAQLGIGEGNQKQENQIQSNPVFNNINSDILNRRKQMGRIGVNTPAISNYNVQMGQQQPVALTQEELLSNPVFNNINSDILNRRNMPYFINLNRRSALNR